MEYNHLVIAVLMLLISNIILIIYVFLLKGRLKVSKDRLNVPFQPNYLNGIESSSYVKRRYDIYFEMSKYEIDQMSKDELIKLAIEKKSKGFLFQYIQHWEEEVLLKIEPFDVNLNVSHLKHVHLSIPVFEPDN